MSHTSHVSRLLSSVRKLSLEVLSLRQQCGDLPCGLAQLLYALKISCSDRVHIVTGSVTGSRRGIADRCRRSRRRHSARESKTHLHRIQLCHSRSQLRHNDACFTTPINQPVPVQQHRRAHTPARWISQATPGPVVQRVERRPGQLAVALEPAVPLQQEPSQSCSPAPPS